MIAIDGHLAPAGRAWGWATPPAATHPPATAAAAAAVQDCAHALKLRHSVKIDPRTRLELGLDLDLVDSHGLRQTLQNSAPWAAMLHQVGGKQGLG